MLRRIVITALCLLSLLAPGVQAADQTQPIALYSGGGAVSRADQVPIMDEAVVRREPLTLIQPALDAVAGRSAADPLDQQRLSLPLFDGETVIARRTRYSRDDKGAVWEGVLEGKAYSQVLLLLRDGRITGNISWPFGHYQLRFSDGQQWLLKTQQSRYPAGAEPIPVAPAAGDVRAVAEGADDGSTIDVLVMYTPAAQSEAGGETEILDLIDLAVAETNSSYANSGVSQRLRLVHVAETDYTESDFSTDLSRITDQGDGHMDEAHTLRDTHAADLVAMIRKRDGAYCGLAWLQKPVRPSFESNGFSATTWNCATGYYSFGHELGHNMGATHDTYVSVAGSGAFDYAHGYVNTSGRWRTVMGYNSECSNLGFNCTRLQYWSNPDELHEGDAMGVAEQADNRLTLNNSAYIVANFRVSSVAAPGELAVTPSSTWQVEARAAQLPGESNSYTLENVGGSDLDYSVSLSQGWLSTDQEGGTLAPGDTVQLTLTLAASASTLAVGDHSATLSVTDTSNDVQLDRAVAVTVLAEPTPGLLTVSGENISSSGDEGGPFAPASGSFSLGNDGDLSLSYTAQSDAAWLSLSPTSGSIAAGNSQAISATLNASANSLAPGDYSATLTFSDTADADNSMTRSVSLRVDAVVGELSIPDASLDLLQDEDGDGNHRRFRISFAPVISTGSASVQAAILVRPNGGDWSDFDRTTSFSVDDGDNLQSLEWTLESGFNSGEYDFAIELFRDGEEVAAARRDKDDDSDLDNVPLERAELDQPQPELRTDPTTLSFTASVGQTGTNSSLQLNNDGLGLLSVSAITVEPATAWVSVNAIPDEIAAGQRHDIGVTIDWQLAPHTQHSVQLRIESNDPNSPHLVPISLDNRANLPEDNYEPNDSREAAFPLDSHAGTWLDQIDGGGWQRDEDWYRIRLTAIRQRLTVELLFDSGENVDIALFDDTGTELASASDGEDSETLTGEYMSGDYFVRLTGNGQSSYKLRWNALEQHELNVQVSTSSYGRVVSVPAGIDCDDRCNAWFDHGESVELSAIPRVGMVFAGWEGVDCPGTGACVFNINAPANVTASFLEEARLIVTPEDVWLAEGLTGGPFAPASKTFTLQNAGGVSLEYSVASEADWVDLPASGGTLAAAESQDFVLGLKASANQLAAGDYRAAVTFTRLPDGPSVEREVWLLVSPQPGKLVVDGDNFSASGRQGGELSPSSTQYTLRNTGETSLSFGVVENGDLVDISSPSGGELQPGDSRVITVSLSSDVPSWPVGSHSSVLRFNDTTNDETIERQVLVSIAEPPGELAVDPTTPFDSSGTVGGPFAPVTASYSLRNDGGSPLEFSAALDVDWVELSAASGTLAAGSSESLQLSLTAAAEALAVGQHQGSLTITDLSNGGSVQRAVLLTVEPTPGELTVSPAGAQSISGTVGGPFSPNSLSYSLGNTGGSALDFTASSDQPWLELSLASGSLSAGEGLSVNASLTSAADALPAGEHRAELSFSAGDVALLREVLLTVNALGELSVGPATELLVSGAVGGPFALSSVEFILSNIGGSPIDYSASSDQAWLSLAPGSGNLAAGDSATIIGSLTGAAEALPVGDHLATVTFSDSEGKVLQRSLRLSISELPPAAAPAIDPEGGTFAEAVEVRLQSSSTGVSLRYTLDGSEPSATHGTPLANGGTLSVSASATLRAVAFGEGWLASSAASAEFVIDPELDSDGDGMPDLYEREHGLDMNDGADAAADLDGDGRSNIEEFREGTDPQRDDVPPLFQPQPVVELDATGFYTRVSLTPPLAQDHRDGEIAATAGEIGTEVGRMLRPGRYTIIWLAMDAAGNAARVEQLLKLRPRVSLAGDQLVGEGQSVEVRALLNGDAADYPVELPFSVSGTAVGPGDHNAVNGVLWIDAGIEGSLEIDIVEDGVAESRETLQITLGEPMNAALGARISQQITIADENLPPMLRLSVVQGGSEVRGLKADGGEVSLRVEIEDPNPGQSHSIDWSHSEASLLSQAGIDGDTLRFDPAGMAAGVYSAAVVVTDNGTPNQRTLLHRWLPLDVSLPPASDLPHLLLGVSDQDDGLYLIAGDSGLALSLGGVGLSVGSGDALLTADELARYTGSRSTGGLNDSLGHVGGTFEIEASGMGEIDGLVKLVIPLQAAVPDKAILRLHQLDSGWRNWQDADGESLKGMVGEPGLCAEPGSDAWGELAAGQHCLQVTLRDGGANDADGEANGAVRFLGGLAAEQSADGGNGSSGGGGGGSPLWLLMLAGGLAAWRHRHRVG